MVVFMVTVLCPLFALAQVESVRMDTVISFHPGIGQTTGQGSEFFPSNVLRGPDPNASDSAPSVNGREVCSIGLGGEIVLGLTSHVVVDEEGADFIIFENAFLGPLGKVYAEPAQVSVSKDGVQWTDFPFDSLTLQGCAGRTPTHGGDPFVWPDCGGDGFDLADIGVDSVRFVRIRDVTSIVKGNAKHPFYDPTLSGFDLDVVTVPHARSVATVTGISVVPRSTTVMVTIPEGNGKVTVYDVYGAMMQELTVQTGISFLDMTAFVNTCLIVTLTHNSNVFMVKVLP